MVVPNVFACAVDGLAHGLLNPDRCNGGGGDDVEHSYKHVQAVATDPWVINHGLTWDPAAAQIKDGLGNTTFATWEVTIPGQQITLTFGSATAGTAWLS